MTKLVYPDGTEELVSEDMIDDVVTTYLLAHPGTGVLFEPDAITLC